MNVSAPRPQVSAPSSVPFSAQEGPLVQHGPLDGALARGADAREGLEVAGPFGGVEQRPARPAEDLLRVPRAFRAQGAAGARHVAMELRGSGPALGV